MSVAVDSDAEDDAVSEIAEAAGVSPAPAKPSMSAPRRMLLFGLVVVVALAVLLCCWGFRVQRARHAQDQRGHFLQAARQCALNLTTIDWRNAEADVRRILDGATGEFYNDFAQRSQPFVEVLRHAKASTVGTITEALAMAPAEDENVPEEYADWEDAEDYDDYDDYEAADQEAARSASWRRRLRVRLPRLSTIAMAAAVVIICGFTGLSGYIVWQHHEATERQQRAAAFAAGAKQGVINMTSLDFNKAKEDVARVIDSSTGEFRDDFQQRAADFTKVVEQSKVVTEGTVNATAVESMNEHSAVVLVAATSRVTNSAGAKDEPRAWRLKVTVTEEGGQYKMSKVEFVP